MNEDDKGKNYCTEKQHAIDRTEITLVFANDVDDKIESWQLFEITVQASQQFESAFLQIDFNGDPQLRATLVVRSMILR